MYYLHHIRFVLNRHIKNPLTHSERQKEPRAEHERPFPGRQRVTPVVLTLVRIVAVVQVDMGAGTTVVHNCKATQVIIIIRIIIMIIIIMIFLYFLFFNYYYWIIFV